MKPPFRTLLLGAAVAIAAHVTYVRLHAPPEDPSFAAQLHWMKTELNLTDAQFVRIAELHQESHPRLQRMASEVAAMQAEYVAFERERRNSGQVDFIEFARFVENRRNLDRDCLDSTRRLVLASADVMTPQQRERYLALINAAEPVVGAWLK